MDCCLLVTDYDLSALFTHKYIFRDHKLTSFSLDLLKSIKLYMNACLSY